MSDGKEAADRPSRPQQGERVEVIGEHRSGQVIVRETGRFYRGVFLVPRDQFVIRLLPLEGELA